MQHQKDDRMTITSGSRVRRDTYRVRVLSDEELLSTYEVLLSRKTLSEKTRDKKMLSDFRPRVLEKINEETSALFADFEMLVVQRARNGTLKANDRIKKDELRLEIIQMMGKNHF